MVCKRERHNLETFLWVHTCMNGESRPPRIMVTCGGRIPSVELGAIIPLSELQKQGLCVFKYKDEPSLSLADLAWCDILFIVRGASSLSLLAADRAKKLQRIVLGYWDDDLLSIPTWSLSYPYYANAPMRENISALFKLTDAFFSRNPKLAAKLSSLHGSEAKVLPGVLWAEKLGPLTRDRNPIPVVGFAGSVDHRDLLNSLLGPSIAAVLDTGVDFKFHIVGPEPNFIGKLRIETIHTPYIRNFYDYLAVASDLGWDVGLAPLIDSEFTMYKFYNKLIEYTFIGCAGIYSRVEPYTGVIEDGITGLLVENEVGAWKEAILRLLMDPELRFRIATNAREFVQTNLNRRVAVEQYAAILGPFFTYRAPEVGITYVGKSYIYYEFKKLYNLWAEYAKIFGMIAFIRAASSRLLSLLAPKPF